MKERYIKKFLQELPVLIEKNIIDGKTSEKIKDYYNSLLENSGKSSIFAIISSIAGLLIGSGIILLLAHNWDELSRNAKTTIAFLPLITGQILSGYSYLKNKSFAWTESSAIFLSLSIGSTIALISQIYHMPGDMESYLFVWILLILPLVYIMKSIGVLIIYLVQIIFWSIFAQNFSGHAAFYWVFLATIMPFIYNTVKGGIFKNRNIVILWFLSANILTGIGIALENVIPGLWIIVYSFLLIIFYHIGILYFKKDTSLFHNPFKVIGIGGIIALSYLFTFKYVWYKVGWDFIRNSDSGNFFYHGSYNHTVAIIDYFLIFLFISTILFLLTRLKKYHLIKETIALSIFALLAISAYLIAAISHEHLAPQIIFNIYLFFTGGLIIYTGVADKALYKINLGMMTILLVIISRFFDMDISFTTKGIIFISLGFMFLFVNLYLSKKFIKKEIS